MEIRGFVRRVQDDLYFGSDNVRVALDRIDERLGNAVTREDLVILKISMTGWFLRSILSPTGIIVTAFR